MKNLIKIKTLLAGLSMILCFNACKKELNTGKALNINQSNLAGPTIDVSQVNLVADTDGFGAARIDTNLANAWGLAAVPNGPIWISANHTGLSVIYDNVGLEKRPPVTIPAAMSGQAGAPDGVVFNNTADFGGNKFIFASEDGIITAWKSGNSAVKVAAGPSANTVYKGIAMAMCNTSNFLFLTDFKGGKIDVFDKNFNYVANNGFHDPNIPAGFAPFNVVNIDGKLFVTYAKQKGPDNMDDQKGPGNGYVDIYDPNGTLMKRFASQGALNSPWGIAVAPAGFADDKGAILVGNFGDGHISIFDMDGDFKGQLEKNGQALSIDGLWAIDFLQNSNAHSPLYFTAGPNDESHGLFGYLQKH